MILVFRRFCRASFAAILVHKRSRKQFRDVFFLICFCRASCASFHDFPRHTTQVDSDGNAYFRGVAQTIPRSDEESDGEEEFEGIGDGEGRSKDGQKENDPVMGNAPISGRNSRRGSRADRTDRHVGAGGGKGGKGAATVTEHERRGGKGKGKGKVSVRAAKEAVVKAEKGLRNGSRNVVENEVKGGARNGARSGAEKSGVAVSGSRIKVRVLFRVTLIFPPIYISGTTSVRADASSLR